MATLLRLSSRDHGRRMSLEEFLSATHQEGRHYELIKGRVYVSPLPNLPEDSLEVWVSDALRAYMASNSEVINHVTNKARVFIPAEEETTAPEPDVAAYQDFPHHLPRRQLRWQDVSPLLVV